MNPANANALSNRIGVPPNISNADTMCLPAVPRKCGASQDPSFITHHAPGPRALDHLVRSSRGAARCVSFVAPWQLPARIAGAAGVPVGGALRRGRTAGTQLEE